MENKSKKSKALIITIIAIILLLIIGYFLFKNKDNLFAPSSGMNKIFSSLDPSSNKEVVTAQAGEDIKKGDSLSTSGTDANGNPIVVKANGNSNVFGFANEDIANGEFGEITLNTGGANNFWNSFSGFLSDIFTPGGGEITPTTTGGWVWQPNGGPNGEGGWVPIEVGGVIIPADGWVWQPNGGPNGEGGWIPIEVGGVIIPADGWVWQPNGGPWGNGGWVPPDGNGGWVPPDGGDQWKNPPSSGVTPDLIAGPVTPTSTVTNTSTNLSSVITNIGNGATGHSFSALFVITKGSNPSTPSNEEGGDVITFFNKVTSTSKAVAAVETEEGGGPVSNIVAELPVTIPRLWAGTGYVSNVSYNFSSVGTYSIRVCADKNSSSDPGTVAESNEENNCGEWKTFIVYPNSTDLAQCNDNIDNDTDTKIDELDPNCHIDGDLNKEYVAEHNDESSNPPAGGGMPDLTAGAVTPTTTITNTSTKLSSVITNIGDGSTKHSFSALFVITKASNIITPPNNEGDDVITKSKSKNIFNKFFNKATSKAIAAVNTDEGGGPTTNIVALLPVTIPTLRGESGYLSSVSYNFSSVGTYSIRVCADKNSSSDPGTVAESNEENNCGEWKTFIVYPNSTDLAQCNDNIDNDTDTKIDELDPNCHIDGDLNKEYVAEHNDESSNPLEGEFPECNDKIDNDGDTKIDKFDPNCHIDGDLNKDYVAEHNDESSNPPEGGGTPDLTAGKVTPTTTITNTPTKLSSVITNSGNGGTGSSFSSFFAIIKVKNNPLNDTGNSTTLKSGTKNIFTKFLNKITSTSKAVAALNTNEGGGGPTSNDNIELSVVVSTIPAKMGKIANVTHTFSSVGTYNIRVCADKSSSSDTGTITESNEGNNCGPWTIFIVTSSLPVPIGGEFPECSDKIDNDDDNKIDILDPNCHIGGDIWGDYVPEHNSEAVPPPTGGESNGYQCGDLEDNDKDGKIDIADPNCHLDGDMGKEYIPTHDDESSSQTTPVVDECLLIENNPLVFNDAEKAELAQLLRKFYLIAPTLKTDEDISLVYSEIDQYKNFTNQLDVLIDECYTQGISREGVQNPNWPLIPAKRYGNPWFKPYDRGSATNLYTGGDPGGDRIYTNFWVASDWWIVDPKALIPYKLVNGYYTGTTHDGQDCSDFDSTIYGWGWSGGPSHYYSDPRRDFEDPFPDTGDWEDMLSEKNVEIINKGCKWNPGTRFELMEYLLNIW